MSRENDLPFERGSTYYEGDTAMIAADPAGIPGIEGKVFETYDSQNGQLVILKAVRNRGSTLTTPAGRGVLPAAAYIDRGISAFVGTAGAYGYIMDPAHVGDFVANDIGYVVIGGFCRDAQLGASNAVDLAVCVFNATGRLIPVGSTDGHIVGRFAEAVTSTGDGNERVDAVVGSPAANYND